MSNQGTITKHEVIHEMWAHGGSFMHCLAVAWYAADDYNRDLIETVWGREFHHHAVMAQKRKEARNGHHG